MQGSARSVFPRLAVFLFFVVILGVYGFRLGSPQKMYYDENYHVNSARSFLKMEGYMQKTHPPLGKLMIAAGIAVAGDHSWVWRFPSLLTGVGALFFFFLLARRFLKNDWFALMAAFLLAIDGMSITQARIGCLYSHMLFFMMVSIWLFVKFLDAYPRRRFLYLLLTAFFLGCAVAVRWIGLAAVFVMAILLVHRWPRLKNPVGLALPSALSGLLFLAVYFSAFLILPFMKGNSWRSIWDAQSFMLHYHNALVATHNYQCEWWSWPFMKRPIWYFFERKNNIVQGIVCLGNPAVLWMLFPALGYLIPQYLKTKSAEIGFVLLGFLSQWLPWIWLGRRIAFFHYYYPAMPFVVLAIVLYLRGLWSAGKGGKYFAAVYLAFALALFIYWYPLLAAYPISEKYFQHHLWFKSWI